MRNSYYNLVVVLLIVRVCTGCLVCARHDAGDRKHGNYKYFTLFFNARDGRP